ncbi:hypothetical protein BH23PAT2_BH23PAT2_03080 [soil metagenome]
MSPEEQQKTTKTPRNKLKSRQLIIAVALLLVIATGIGVLTINQKKTVSLPCSDDMALLERAGEFVGSEEPEDIDNLERVVTEVEELPDHEKDVNCKYIVASYSVHRDLPRAKEALNDIKFLRSAGQEIAEEFSPYSSIEYIETRIQIQEITLEEAALNAQHINIPVDEIEHDERD